MNTASSDQTFMARAIALARKGRFTTTPNPSVGCVLVSPEGEVVGEGWHQKAGSPHAEVHALAQAGERAKGATAYVTLEPCSHTGRTPPCADALIAAGVARVVAAMVDPNPQVSGRGLARLEGAGIEVTSGVLEQDARALNRGFIHRMVHGRPWVTVKLAASLDGRTALANGVSQWITGPDARRDVQLHRAQSCAILSGSGTVLADDPSLNVRPDELPQQIRASLPQSLRQPLRVILDGRNQLNGDRKLFNLPGDTLVINSRENPALPSSVLQWQAANTGNKLDLPAVFAELAQRGLNEVWVEAGSRLAGALLQQRLVDELILYQAPKIMGHAAQGLFDLDALTDMAEVVTLKWLDVRQVGADLKIVASPQYPTSEN